MDDKEQPPTESTPEAAPPELSEGAPPESIPEQPEQPPVDQPGSISGSRKASKTSSVSDKRESKTSRVSTSNEDSKTAGVPYRKDSKMSALSVNKGDSKTSRRGDSKAGISERRDSKTSAVSGRRDSKTSDGSGKRDSKTSAILGRRDSKTNQLETTAETSSVHQENSQPDSISKRGSKTSAISGKTPSKTSNASKTVSAVQGTSGQQLSVIPDEQEDEYTKEEHNREEEMEDGGEGAEEEVTEVIMPPVEGAELIISEKPTAFSSKLSFDMRLSIDSSETGRLSKLGFDKKGKKDLWVKAKALGSIISIRRGSYGDGTGGGPKVVKYMNSYKLDPEKPFHVETVQKILQEVLNEALDELTYDPETCVMRAKWATSALRAKLKEHEYDRYKLLCLVTIGEKRSHDVFTSMKFLWDPERDKYAAFATENMFVFGYACCFGFYYE